MDNDEQVERQIIAMRNYQRALFEHQKADARFRIQCQHDALKANLEMHHHLFASQHAMYTALAELQRVADIHKLDNTAFILA